MYRFELSDEEIFTNRIKTYPSFDLFIYQGSLYVNNKSSSVDQITTKFAPPSELKDGTGGIQVYELNNNRIGTDKVYPFIVPSSVRQDFRANHPNPIVKMFSEHQGYTGPNSFISSNRLSNYDLTSNRTSSYPDEVPVTRRLTDPISSFEATYYHIADDKVKTEEIALPVSNLNLTASSLQNVAKKYLPHSPHFEFNSSVLNRNLLSSSINFVFIPRMYYGSAIKRGSVALNYYLTGALMASCTDERENGELIETHGFRSGSTVGIVLYDEGVIMLTASHMLEQVTTSSIEYTPGTAISSSWMYYGTTLNDGTGSSGTLSVKPIGCAGSSISFLASYVFW